MSRISMCPVLVLSYSSVGYYMLAGLLCLTQQPHQFGSFRNLSRSNKKGYGGWNRTKDNTTNNNKNTHNSMLSPRNTYQRIHAIPDTLPAKPTTPDRLRAVAGWDPIKNAGMIALDGREGGPTHTHVHSLPDDHSSHGLCKCFERMWLCSAFWRSGNKLCCLC